MVSTLLELAILCVRLALQITTVMERVFLWKSFHQQISQLARMFEKVVRLAPLVEVVLDSGQVATLENIVQTVTIA